MLTSSPGSGLTRLTILLIALCLSAAASGQKPPRIGELSYLDRQYMQQQRELLQDLSSRNLGRQLNGERDNDLEVLQLLLDRRLVRSNQTRELQAMGVVMGDLLAEDLGMNWVIYEDGLGRSRALRLGLSDNYLFPITMVSRRQEADNQSSVTDIYRKAYDIIAPLRPPLPFQ